MATQIIQAHNVVVGDIIAVGAHRVTRVLHGPGTFHTYIETDDGVVTVRPDDEPVRVVRQS